MFDGVDFSKMGDMFAKAQEQAQKMQDDAKNRVFSAKSGGGMVKVSMNGSSELIDICIDDELLNDKESMQILLMSAINDAINMVEEDKKRSASEMLSSFGGFAN